LATASGLMIESVRSMAMAILPETETKKGNR